jgi:hypothetical protein
VEEHSTLHSTLVIQAKCIWGCDFYCRGLTVCYFGSAVTSEIRISSLVQFYLFDSLIFLRSLQTPPNGLGIILILVTDFLFIKRDLQHSQPPLT